MAKSASEALKHFKKNSKSIWSFLWAIMNFIWLCYFTFLREGKEQTEDVIVEKIFVGLLPLVITLIAVYVYHYLRSDLYLEQSKPNIGKSLIPGTLLKMVEHWKSEPIVGFVNSNVQFNAYKILFQYRSSYDFDHIHSQIDEFIKAFEVGGSSIMPEIKTSFSTKKEAEDAFPRLKQLAKEIGRELT